MSRYVIYQFINNEWFIYVSNLTRYRLIKFLSIHKEILNSLVDISIKSFINGNYLILKDGYTIKYEPLFQDIEKYNYKHTKFKKYIFRKYPVHNIHRKKFNKNYIHKGIRRICSINMDPLMKDFYDPSYNINHLLCFDYYFRNRKDKCWKKQYKVRKQWQIH